MSNQINDQLLESLQVWCEQYGQRLSDAMEDDRGYFLEVNDDVEDRQIYLPKNYQEMDLGRFIKGYVTN